MQRFPQPEDVELGVPDASLSVSASRTRVLRLLRELADAPVLEDGLSDTLELAEEVARELPSLSEAVSTVSGFLPNRTTPICFQNFHVRPEGAAGISGSTSTSRIGSGKGFPQASSRSPEDLQSSSDSVSEGVETPAWFWFCINKI